MEDILIDSCYGVGEDDRDFILGEDLSVLDLAPIQDDIHYFYNQSTLLGGKLRAFCTVMSPIHLLSSIWNRKLTTQQRESLREFAQKKFGYREGVGHYVQSGVHCAVQRWNETFPEEKSIFLRIDNLISMTVAEAWKKGYGVANGYGGDRNYNLDRDKDGIVDGVKFTREYGHAVPIFGKEKTKVHDSYEGRKTNEYILKDIISLRKNNVFYPTAYIIVPDPNNELLNKVRDKRNEITKLIKENMDMNSMMWHKVAEYPDIAQVTLAEIRDGLNRTNNAYRKIV